MAPNAVASLTRIVAMEVGWWRSVRRGSSARSVTRGYFRDWELELGSSFARGGKKALPDQERVCGNAEGRVVVEAAPSSALVVMETKLVLELLVITLDAPPEFGGAHQFLE